MKNKFISHIFKYILRGLSLLFAVSIISFILITLSPIDPIKEYTQALPGISGEHLEKVRQYWGVDQPPVTRYLTWFSSVIKGDLGTSLIYRRPVINIISEKFSSSFILMIFAWTFSGIIGIVLGTIMGINEGNLIDRILKRFCLIMCSIPTFWIGILFMMFFSVFLGWFPIGMSVPSGILSSEVTILQRLHHLILPAFTLSFISFSNISLHAREKIIDVLHSDYVLFAKARGESLKSILINHCFRNMLSPIITLQFASFSELFSGSVFIENIFSYPGLAVATSESGLKSDIPLLLGIVLFSTVFIFTGNMIANILYEVINPEIKVGANAK